jgi:hypothetical protein
MTSLIKIKYLIYLFLQHQNPIDFNALAVNFWIYLFEI